MISPPSPFLTGLIVTAFCASATYTFFLWFRPWRRNAATRALMLKSWGNLILLSMGLATALFGDYAYREPIRTAGFAVFLAGLLYLLRALLTSPGARDYPPFKWRRK